MEERSIGIEDKIEESKLQSKRILNLKKISGTKH